MPPERGKIYEFFEHYLERNLSIPIIVEGDNDIRSLRSLGFPGEIIKLNSGMSLMAFSESISRSYREIIILTDMDRKGIMLKDSLTGFLVSLGTRVDAGLWHLASRRLRIKSVEDLPAALDRIAAPKIIPVQTGRHARY